MKIPKNHPRFRAIIGDAVAYFPAQVVPAVVGFVAIAVYTRLLSPRVYGQYILVLTTTSTALLFLFSWLNHAILRFLPENREHHEFPAFYATLLLVFLGILVPVSALWYTLTYLSQSELDPELSGLFTIGLWVLWAQAGYSLLLSILRAERQAITYSLVSSIAAIGRLGLAVILLIFFSLGAAAILWATVAIAGLLSLWGALYLYRKWEIRPCRPSRTLLKKYAVYGFPLALVGAGEMILSLSDRYLIGYYLGADMVGVYAAGYDITSVTVGFFFTVLLLAAYPILIQTYAQEGEDQVRAMLKDLLGLYFLALCPITTGVAALAQEGVILLLGKSFASAAAIIPWVAGGIFFLGLAFCFNKPFQLKKKTRILIFPILTAGIINLALNSVLIPRWGIKGAAIATLTAYGVYATLNLWLSKKIFTWSLPWSTGIKTAFASLGMYAMLMATKPAGVDIFSLGARILSGVVFYALLLFILRESLFRRGLSFVASRLFTKRIPK